MTGLDLSAMRLRGMLRDLYVGQNPSPDWDSFLWAREATGLQNWVEAREWPLAACLCWGCLHPKVFWFCISVLFHGSAGAGGSEMSTDG